ncbi:Uncharacterised protein [Actinobacillus seminis]|uniref:Uncharacterized protein n=1 Tax=Actinobacillus seminis TaxID=722 RepID=A0A380VAQ1_9PAST|nr:hypothetical protein [Actinobacillus seminis]SUU35142.1 Uncharacterised protein [Actinobacillus seminis]
MTFWQKTFGGLNLPYYIRHFLFGLIFFIFFVVTLVNNQYTSIEKNIVNIILFSILQLLYPYSRFVYESIIGYIMGENVFFFPAFIMLLAKFITMVICWIFSFAIAPIGLVYLYYFYSRQEKKEKEATPPKAD